MLPRFVAALLLWILTGVARAEEPAVVNGAVDPARDVPAVQAAVDRGGAVVLEGRFDFGERGRVTIRRSVSISGDAGNSARDPRGTAIKGGFWTFFSPLPDKQMPFLDVFPKCGFVLFGEIFEVRTCRSAVSLRRYVRGAIRA